MFYLCKKNSTYVHIQAKIDTKSKLIDTYEVTSAEVHDSQPTEKLLREEDQGQEFHADSAYNGDKIEKTNF